MLVIGLVVIGYRLLVIGYLLLVTGYRLLVIGLLVTDLLDTNLLVTAYCKPHTANQLLLQYR